MNNFRGFADTTIPLKKVNFFVGENSTGKTSLLALLELLATQEFWFEFNFNAKMYEFGGYKDIVSVLSPDQSEFQIGLSQYDAKNPKATGACMLHFSQSDDGLPELQRLSLLCAEYVVTVQISETQITIYSHSDAPRHVDGLSSDIFAYLRKISKHTTQKNNILQVKNNYSGPIFIVIQHILYQNKKKIPNYLKLGDLPFPAFSFLPMPFISIAPIRTTPKRTYDGYTRMFNPQGEHTPYVIRKTLPGKSKTNAFKKALDEFGVNSGLFESIGITKLGDDSTSPFELTITLSGKALRINSVGYGVSQVLPIIVELLSRKRNAWLAIQQPEVHLHPKAQAALGDLLYHAATGASHTLFVETHSDYLIDRYRIAIREAKNFADSTQVVFFERTSTGNRAYTMILNSNGEYPGDQPPGFRDFFLKEQMRILEI